MPIDEVSQSMTGSITRTESYSKFMMCNFESLKSNHKTDVYKAPEKMKIAIPTHDGLTLVSGLNDATAYLVLTLELGEITNQEKRMIQDKKGPVNGTRSYDDIPDCEVLLVRDTMESSIGMLNSLGKEIIMTHEIFITSAIMHYLGAEYRKESNTCCCP